MKIMKRNNKTQLCLTLIVFIFLSAMATTVQARSSLLITKEELKGMLGDANLVILDTRTGRDWKSSEFKIKGAVRANPYAFDSWSGTYAKDQKLVLYCA